ncbi:MAG: glycine--tRNA ligase [Candidatus Micrarchaeota archaeon]
MELHERILELAVSRSFFFPANEPYGTTGGFYDYGPVGVLIKRKIENLWRRRFIYENGFHEMESAIVTPEQVLVASGHVASFADPVVDCKMCKARIRADTLVEKEVKGWKWDGKVESITSAIKEHGVKCPGCKTGGDGALGKAYMFNLMFKTAIGGDHSSAYCRPETAQGIFTAFPRIFRNHGAKLPLAVGQVGKSFRNEISPRKGLVRMREFTQMELEYFFNPGKQGIEGFETVAGKELRMQVDGKTSEMSVRNISEQGIAANEIMAYFLALEWNFYIACGVDQKRMYFRVLGKTEVPHYSKGNIDLEVETSYGIVETIGNAYRTDFDLSQHAKTSGQDLSVFVEEEKKKLIPHVFEASMGVDRMFFCILEHCFREKEAPKSKTEDPKPGAAKDWEWFDFPPAIAPYDVAVFPLMKKDGLAEKAEEITAKLRSTLGAFYQESGSIGRRYARADEIGIPYALTIDYDTLKDETVTIRYRNDGKQERIKINELEGLIRKNIEAGRVRLE